MPVPAYLVATDFPFLILKVFGIKTLGPCGSQTTTITEALLDDVLTKER